MPAGAEDQGLDRGMRETECLRDLGVAQALPLAEEDRAAEVRRHRRERVVEPHELVALGLRRRDTRFEQLEVVRRLDLGPPRVSEVSREADVVGDLVEPGRLELGHDALPQRCIDAQEGVLDSILGVFA